jgi:hypothetical protein
VTALRGLAGEYTRYALAGPSHASAVWAAWYVNWSLIVLFPDGLLTLLLLLFPDGRPLTRRWWAVFWSAAGLRRLSPRLYGPFGDSSSSGSPMRRPSAWA